MVNERTTPPPVRHVGIIMDGNGRWATARKLRRTRGHKAGTDAAKRVILEAIALRIECVSLYAFSTENWRRAEEEVAFIMDLVACSLRDQYDFYRQNDVRVMHSGDIEGLPTEVRSEIGKVTAETRENRAITVNLAVNYGGRDEIVRAVNRVLAKDPARTSITTQDVCENLDLAQLPDPI